MAQGSKPFNETARYWLKLGFISFGGPTGQIAIMHKDLVEKKKWIAEDHFLLLRPQGRVSLFVGLLVAPTI